MLQVNCDISRLKLFFNFQYLLFRLRERNSIPSNAYNQTSTSHFYTASWFDEFLQH